MNKGGPMPLLVEMEGRRVMLSGAPAYGEAAHPKDYGPCPE
jgi:hypothetical protein